MDVTITKTTATTILEELAGNINTRRKEIADLHLTILFADDNIGDEEAALNKEATEMMIKQLEARLEQVQLAYDDLKVSIITTYN